MIARNLDAFAITVAILIIKTAEELSGRFLYGHQKELIRMVPVVDSDGRSVNVSVDLESAVECSF